jgi:hypothetical protein
MSGIRIQHPTGTNVTYTLVDGGRPYRMPLMCPACHRVHEFKTYHFRLDDSGAAIVSTTIWERLSRIPGHPFRLANEVKEPPPQRLELPFIPRIARAPAPGDMR